MDTDQVGNQRRLRDILPPGTMEVGGGLIVAGATSYVYLVLTARTLGPSHYVPLSVLWASVFIAAGGLFTPLRYEVGRLVAQRRLDGDGTGPIIKRAAVLGAGLAGVVLVLAVVILLIAGGRLFDGEPLLTAAFALSVVGYWLLSVLWGGLAGIGRFRHVAYSQSGDCCLRLAVCLCLVLVGVRTAGPYGLALGVAPILAALVFWRPNMDLLAPGPVSPWSNLSRALGWLLVGSLGAQVLINGPIVAVSVLATPADRAHAGHLLAGLVLSRVPLFLFGAAEAALLPNLAGLARAERWDEFRTGWFRLFLLVVAIVVVAVVAVFLVGPPLLRFLFGDRFALGRSDLTYLTAASGAYMLTLTVVQAQVALGHHARSAVGWLVGIAVFLIVIFFGHSLLPRVEIGYLTGALSAFAVASGLLYWSWPRGDANRHRSNLAPGLAPWMSTGPQPQS